MNKKYLNKFLILLTLLFCAQIKLTAQDETFQSDVQTSQKPWTHLDFYNDPMNFQFAIVSDNTGGSREGIFEKAINKINLLKPEFVMCVGDLIQGYTQDTAQINFEWNEFNTSLEKLQPPFFYLPGNHDITNTVMQREWEKRYGRRYYHFVYKNTLFITMDSNDDDDFSISEDQMNYVIESLKNNEDVRWTFIFMHHPIWTYDTNQRFEKIESELKGRKYTVFAGHNHRYHHKLRNEHNYYILATTGGSSSLEGHRFGRFDHITWLTLTDDGPVFANLELNNILPHDVSNDETKQMAESMLKNASFENILLTNDGEKFSDGTLYIHFNNSTYYDLTASLQFFHNHDVNIDNSKLNFIMIANSDTTVAIPIRAMELKDYSDIDLLQFDWSFSYLDEKYSDFHLEGKYELLIKSAAKSNYISPSLLQFSDTTSVRFNSPFKDLMIKFTDDGSIPELQSKLYVEPILLNETTQITFALFNDKNQSVQLPRQNYEKVKMTNSIKVDHLSEGLKYKYYEGEWSKLPDFNSLQPVKYGETLNFLVSDIADHEDDFGIVFDGYINIPTSDMYLFRMRADDASRLYVHNKITVDEETGIDFGAVYLEKGYHPVKIEYIERKGNERLRMYYKNKQKEEWIFMPFEMFFYN